MMTSIQKIWYRKYFSVYITRSQLVLTNKESGTIHIVSTIVQFIYLCTDYYFASRVLHWIECFNNKHFQYVVDNFIYGISVPEYPTISGVAEPRIIICSNITMVLQSDK